MSNDPYEQPKTPPATPPVIDPNVDPKEAAELADDGDARGSVTGARSDPSQIDTERSDELVRRNRRDGSGEAELDKMPPD